MKDSTKKIIIAGILVVFVIVAIVFLANKTGLTKKISKPKKEEITEEEEIENIVEDYNSMDMIELKSRIDKKEEEIRKTNEEIANLNEEFGKLSEQLRELSQEEAEKIEGEIREANKVSDKSYSEIIIEESDSDEIKIQKIRDKMEALHTMIEKQNKLLEEQTADIGNAYDVYANYSTTK